MLWKDRPGRANVEDRRGMSSGYRTGSGRRMRAGGIPLWGKTGVIVVLIVLVAGYYGIDLTPLITGEPMVSPRQTEQVRTRTAEGRSSAEDELARFSSVALKTTEDVWSAIFRETGKQYAFPKLVLYTGATPTACGYGQAAMGPFYCPADRRVYLDLEFFREMEQRFSAAGDFAQAYVIAHEVGHHVQNLMGISAKINAARQRGARMEGANGLSVRQELQADCFAGVWANRAQQRLNWLEPGDIEEALNAANAIGDDRLQRQGRGMVVPDSFTHGSSAQRMRWFKTGFESGSPASCDTFKAQTL